MGNTKRGKNEGSIRERKDGRFEVRVTSGIDFSTGRSKRISYYANTRAEATKILHSAEYDIHFNQHVDPTSITFLDWLRTWLETYMKQSLKQSMYVSYRGYIENHIARTFPTIKLKDVTTRLLQDFYNYKIQDEGLSPKTITNLHLCLHKAMQQAVLEHHLNFNPCDAVNLPRNEKPQIEILTHEEQERLIYTSYQFRYGVFIRLVLATGIRLGELLGLRWEDINLRTGIMYIRRTLNRLPKADYDGKGNSTEIVIQAPKTKNSIRSITLLPITVKELQQWKSVQIQDSQIAGSAYTDTGYIVTNPLGNYIEPRTFKDYYNEIIKSANLGHFTFHALRHTFASRAMEQGMDSKTLSTILGHYSVSFTLDTYAHVLDTHKREGMKLMEELFSPPVMPQNQSYPVIVTPNQNGVIMNAIDFNDLSVQADDVQKGIAYIQSAIIQRISSSYPPLSTPYSEIILNPGEFIVMVTTV